VQKKKYKIHKQKTKLITMSWNRSTGCPTHCFTLIVIRHPGPGEREGKYLAVEESRNRGWWLPGLIFF